MLKDELVSLVDEAVRIDPAEVERMTDEYYHGIVEEAKKGAAEGYYSVSVLLDPYTKAPPKKQRFLDAIFNKLRARFELEGCELTKDNISNGLIVKLVWNN